jgi:excisionase family DNA binding protein
MKPSTITVREAVAFTGLTRQQVYNLIVNRMIRATKTTGKYGEWAISLASLEQYVEKRRQRRLKRPKPAAGSKRVSGDV